MIYKKEIGENIRKIRKSRGLEQSQLANMLGISDRTVSSWEIGRTEPKMGMIEKLAQVLNCKKSDIINVSSNEIPEYIPGTVELVDLYSKVTPEQRQAVINLLRSFVAQ